MNPAKLLDPAITTGTGQGTVSSGTPTLVSKPLTVPTRGDVGLHVKTTSTLAGTLTVEFSNADDSELAAGTAQWDGYTITVPAISSATSFGIGIPSYEFGRLRVKFVTSSGTGAITVQAWAKGAVA